MTIVEQDQKEVSDLPAEKQTEVLDFITFLRLRLSNKKEKSPKRNSLSRRPAFGSWKQRQIDALAYEQTLRSDLDKSRMEERWQATVAVTAIH
jgi:hypothetical protein